jgi:hypothetical protein
MYFLLLSCVKLCLNFKGSEVKYIVFEQSKIQYNTFFHFIAVGIFTFKIKVMQQVKLKQP